MSIKLKIAWILSVLVTALASFGLVGNGTSASFSDTVTVTHHIQTGQVKLRIVQVDGQALDPVTAEHWLTDVVKDTKADITRVLELRNDGTVDITSLFLTTTPGRGDSTDFAEALSVTVQLGSQAEATEAARTLADWESAPQKLNLPSSLAPGESLTVTMHTKGGLEATREEGRVEPTYSFTAYASD